MALPFELPAVSRGFAVLDPCARATGAEVAAAAARALTDLLGVEVTLTGSARPVAAAPARPPLVLPVELSALPGTALLEVEPGLVSRLVALVSGSPAPAAGATELTPMETSALDLMVLAALDGAAEVTPIPELLAPRLVRDAPAPPSPLAIDLLLEAGPVRGRARLLLPPAAVEALAGPPELQEPLTAFPLFASLRGGSAPLRPEELEALAPGDVLLADAPPEERLRLCFPGGFTALGRVAGGAFLVERTTMENPLEQVPVLVEIELARVPLTLSDLARLSPGSTLPVQLDRRGLVTLRIGERPLGRGELVEVDGAVGVRILSLEVQP